MLIYNLNEVYMKNKNIAVIKKEIQLVEIIVKQGRFNKKNGFLDSHPESYYVKMCLYHMSLKKALECIEKNKKINYH
jgi:hypothetical protein